MKREEIVVVVLRLFAAAIAIWILRDAPGMVTYLYQGDLGVEAISVILGFIIFVIIGLGLWWFPHTIARRLLAGSRTDAEEVSESWSPEVLEQVGFTILGMYLLFSGISRLFYWSFFLYAAKNYKGGPFDPSFGSWAALFTAGIQIAFSLWLILGASGISGMIRKFREAGLRDRA